MGREIKFRGKRIGDNKWVTGFYAVSVSNCHMILEYGFYFGFDYNGICDDDWHEVDPVTVGQHTGLKDKNGIEIYEGDILGKWHEYYYNPEYKKADKPYLKEIGIVEFGDFNCSCCSGVYGYYINGDGDIRELENGTKTIEVIGNIHDNPELITP